MIEPQLITNKLLAWYAENKRDLPWRKSKDPYQIWLSEIILQQTRVKQGLPYFKRFREYYPNVKDLASASEIDILKLWEGLGYYSRARNLHQCAKIICLEHHGDFPKSYKKLLKLPGIGPYTAAAISSICYDENVAVVDGNVFRVLARLYGIDLDIRKSFKYFQSLAQQLLPPEDPGTFNQAIMEFGALQCTIANPDCSHCPLEDRCYAAQHNIQHCLPFKSKAKPVKKRYFHYLVFKGVEDIYMKPRIKGDIWQGLYDFPLIEETRFLDEEEILNRIPEYIDEPFALQEISPEYRHQLSHQQLNVKFYHVIPMNHSTFSLVSHDESEKFRQKDIENLPKPVLITRYLNEYIF